MGVFWLVCCGVLLLGVFVCLAVVVVFFYQRLSQTKNVSPSISPFPFPSLESLDLPTGEAEIWNGPLQPVPNPISKLPHYAFPREKVGFGIKKCPKLRGA